MAKRESPKLTETAETIGAALGHIAGRLDAWKKERPEIAGKLHDLMKSAQDMLGSHAADPSPAAATKKAKASARPTSAGPWSKGKGAGVKAPAAHTKPGDGRATIRATDGRRFTARQGGKG